MTDVANAIETETKQEVKRPKRYNVVFLNDDFTPMDFVVLVLSSVFNRTFEESYAIMMEVHETGRGIAGTYSNEIAIMKQDETLKLAQVYDHPLTVEIEPMNDD